MEACKLFENSMNKIPEGLDYINKPQDYYENDRPEMLEYLPKNVQTILDVGCSNGEFGKALKLQSGAEVWGIEPFEKFGKLAPFLNSFLKENGSMKMKVF